MVIDDFSSVSRTNSMTPSVVTPSVRVLKILGMSMMFRLCSSGPQSSILSRSSLKVDWLVSRGWPGPGILIRSQTYSKCYHGLSLAMARRG
jgi:hypothetical protein